MTEETGEREYCCVPRITPRGTLAWLCVTSDGNESAIVNENGTIDWAQPLRTFTFEAFVKAQAEWYKFDAQHFGGKSARKVKGEL